MQARTVVAAGVGLFAVLAGYRFFHVAIAAGLSATGITSLARHILTARALFYSLVLTAGALALAISCASFLLIRGKLTRKRWKRGLVWALPVLAAGLAISASCSPRFASPSVCRSRPPRYWPEQPSR